MAVTEEKPKFAVVDFQGFRGLKQAFVVKELTIATLTSLNQNTELCHLTFKPPTSEYCDGESSSTPANFWVQRHMHGIAWTDGELEYSELKPKLEGVVKGVSFIFCKGYEKCCFLQSLIQRPVYDLADFGCPSIKTLTASLNQSELTCTLHCVEIGKLNGIVCSRRQAHCLANWMKSNIEAIDLTEVSSRLLTFQLDQKIWRNIENPFEAASKGFACLKNFNNCLQCTVCFNILPIFNFIEHKCIEN